MALKYKKAYITHCDATYAPIVEKMLETVNVFSSIPTIVYVLNSDIKIKNATLTVRYDCQIRDGKQIHAEDKENPYIVRASSKVFDIITKKPNITLDCLEKYAEHVVYLDGDSIATSRIDDLFDYVNDNHPMFTQGIQEYMMLRGPEYTKHHPYAGNPFEDFPEMNKTLYFSNRSLERHLCKLLDVDESFRRNKYHGYVQTGYFSATRKNIEFIKEWISICEMKEVVNEHNKYAPFHEETVVNVLLWKKKWNASMPLVYINCNTVEIIRKVYNFKFDHNKQVNVIQQPWVKAPTHLKDIKIFHGEKRPEIVDLILNEIKYQDLILLFKEDASMVNTVTKMAKINKQLSKRI